MELKPFDPQGGSDQGTGGLDPDEVVAAQLAVGKEPDPLNQPHAAGVLENESRSTLAALGVEIPPPPPQAPAPPPQGNQLDTFGVHDRTAGHQPAPQAQPATPAPAEPDTQDPGPSPSQPDSIPPAIRNIVEKYGGDFEKLAGAYRSAEQKITETSQANKELNYDVTHRLSGLEQGIAELAATVNGAVANLQPGQPGPPNPPALPNGGEITRESWDDDPVGTINSLIASNLIAMDRAKAIQADRLQAKERMESLRAETAQYRPLMDAIRNETPSVYEKLDTVESEELLLKQAKDRAAAHIGVQAFDEVRRLDPRAPEAGAAPGAQPGTPAPGQYPYGVGYSPGVGSANPAGRGAPGAPGPPPGGYGNSPGMQRLMRAGTGSQAEMDAVTEVLRERQFGEHLR